MSSIAQNRVDLCWIESPGLDEYKFILTLLHYKIAFWDLEYNLAFSDKPRGPGKGILHPDFGESIFGGKTRGTFSMAYILYNDLAWRWECPAIWILAKAYNPVGGISVPRVRL